MHVRTYGLPFDVNCSILFTELPLLTRPAAAKAAGFDAVEFWWPWEDPEPSGRDADAFLAALADAGVALISLNFIGGDMAAGERGLLSLPRGSSRFRANIGACTELAARAGCRLLNAPYGNRLDPDDPAACARQDEIAIENLALAARAAAGQGARVMVETINSRDVPAFPIDSSAKAIAVLDAVRDSAPPGSTGFLADLYHLAKMGEDIPDALARYADRIAHVQIADPPGRGAPGTGTLDFGPLFAQLAAQGYDGSVGLEYLPSDPADSSASFGWI